MDDAIGRTPRRIYFGENKLYSTICGKPLENFWCSESVGIKAAVIPVQHINLRKHLRIRDILHRSIIYNVNNNWDGNQWYIMHGRVNIVDRCFAFLKPILRKRFNGTYARSQLRVLADLFIFI